MLLAPETVNGVYSALCGREAGMTPCVLHFFVHPRSEVIEVLRISIYIVVNLSNIRAILSDISG